MKTLIINDLPRTEQLDSKAMSAVQGGMAKGAPYTLSLFGTSKYDFSLDASQLIGQTQNVMNQNGNNVAFASGITSTITPSQDAHNNIYF